MRTENCNNNNNNNVSNLFVDVVCTIFVVAVTEGLLQ